jgi:hypothetical protein
VKFLIEQSISPLEMAVDLAAETHCGAQFCYTHAPMCALQDAMNDANNCTPTGPPSRAQNKAKLKLLLTLRHSAPDADPANLHDTHGGCSVQRLSLGRGPVGPISFGLTPGKHRSPMPADHWIVERGSGDVGRPMDRGDCKAPCCKPGTLQCGHEYCRQTCPAGFAHASTACRHRKNVNAKVHLLCFELFGREKCHACLYAPPGAAPVVTTRDLVAKSIHTQQAVQAGAFECPHTCEGPQHNEPCNHKTATEGGMWKHRSNGNPHMDCTTRCPGYKHLPPQRAHGERAPTSQQKTYTGKKEPVMMQMVHVIKRRKTLELNGRPLTTYDKKKLLETSVAAINKLTGMDNLDDSLAALGWTRNAKDGRTAAEAVGLLTKWGVPVYLATEFADDWGLGKDITVHKVRVAQKRVLGKVSLQVAKDGKIVTRDMDEVIAELVRAAKEGSAVSALPAGGQPVVDLKVAFDGAQVTNNRHNLQLGTLSAPGEGTVADAMSPVNAHVIFAMKAQEDAEEYRAGLVGLAEKLEELLHSHAHVEVDGERVDVNVTIVLDLKSLCMFTGLCAVWQARYCCPFCHTTDAADMQPSALRMTDEVNEFSTQATSAKKRRAPPEGQFGLQTASSIDTNSWQACH